MSTEAGPAKTTGFLRSYLRYCRRILLEPGIFFREEFHRIPLTTALAFGLLSAWGAAILLFFSSSLTEVALQRLFGGWMEDVLEMATIFSTPEEAARSFLYQAGAILVYPFFLLLYLASVASVVLLFSRIFIQDQSQVNYRNCLKILGLALVANWLMVIPVFGELIAYIAFMILAIVGIREAFWVTTQRAALILIAPQVLLFAFFAALIGAVAVAALVWTNLVLTGG